MATSMLELAAIERNLPSRKFNNTESSLRELDRDFPSIRGKTFQGWLDFFSRRRDARILEIGGGEHQSAARDILVDFEGVSQYVGIDRRTPNLQARYTTDTYPGYEFFNIGITEIDRVMGLILPDAKFDVMFAHDVAQYMPNPFYLIELASRLLGDEGVFFCDRLVAYSNVIESVAQHIKENGGDIQFRPGLTPFSYTKPDIAIADIAFQSRGISMSLPLRETDDQLRTSEGERLRIRAILVDRAKMLA